MAVIYIYKDLTMYINSNPFILLALTVGLYWFVCDNALDMWQIFTYSLDGKHKGKLSLCLWFSLSIAEFNALKRIRLNWF